ncbi:hypothetical protein C0992_011587 [Termitomyces sp. T32_za158]|nr:hypothetical protein C0992_011587 [Termitomyces sp. T32_za158]
MSDVSEPTTYIGWGHIALAFTFILFDVVVSVYFGLGIERGLLTASIRCVVQLAIMAVLLQGVFTAKDPWAVAGIAFLLNLLGTFEIVANKAKRRHQHMPPTVPVVGMLCGSSISAIVIAVNYVLKELQENRDKVEMFLAYGASRMEACNPIAREALRLALTPVVNQMSVIGMIAIPGMMTGALLGGAPVDQAAYLQMIIMFMISSATALASFFSAIAVIIITVDTEHRIRPDRIDDKPFVLWRARKWLGKQIVSLAEDLYTKIKNRKHAYGYRRVSQGDEEREMFITPRTPISPFAPR